MAGGKYKRLNVKWINKTKNLDPYWNHLRYIKLPLTYEILDYSRGHCEAIKSSVGPFAAVLLSQQHPYGIVAHSGSWGIGGAGGSEN